MSTDYSQKRLSNQSMQYPGSPLYAGYQWGEPRFGETAFDIELQGNLLCISAVMPRYSSANHPSDLIQQYEFARKAHRRTKGSSKDAPYIQFANAKSEEELIEFVRHFGPVVALSWTNRLPHRRIKNPSDKEHSSFELPMCAVQDLIELKNEQRIYRAAISLILELRKPEKQYDIESASEKISEIAYLMRSWPLQWRRERKACGQAPLWKVRPGMIERVAAMSIRSPQEPLPPQLDARITICQLLNVFPVLVFPNLAETQSYLHYGIRPLLYNLLRREFLHAFDAAVCANPRCRQFFEIERSGSEYCSPECSRQNRQRQYWAEHGKELRKVRASSA